ncbi:MAG: DUF1624 domain-containing protein [Sphingomonas sp.]
MTSQTESNASTIAWRDPSLDVTRGLIVALMALDHVRMYFTSAQFDPTDLAHTDIGYFTARWVTHLCAPGFFFIAGLSGGLLETRAGRPAAARLFVTRGLFLVAMEILVFGVAWSFNPGWWWFGVIAGLGAAMIAMSALMFLPKPVIFVLGAAFTLLHNSLWGAIAPGSETANALLYSADVAKLPVFGPRIVLYPLLPWLALMMMGYAATPVLRRADAGSARRLAGISLALIAAFVLCRAIGFGQGFRGFTRQADTAHSIMAFMNVSKYPPSLQFSLATLGVVLLFLAVIRLADWNRDRLPGWQRLLQTYGQVPFFFYLVHIFLIHASALASATVLGWQTRYLFWHDFGPNLQPPDGYGLPLAGVIVVWLCVLAVMYPICAYFGRLKRNRRSWWLKLL